MDYLIEVRAWALGFDEAEELTEAIGELLCARRLGLVWDGGDESIRAMVSLKPQGSMMDAGEPVKAERVIREAAQGAQLIVVPSETGLLRDRPGVAG